MHLKATSKMLEAKTDWLPNITLSNIFISYVLTGLWEGGDV